MPWAALDRVFEERWQARRYFRWAMRRQGRDPHPVEIDGAVVWMSCEEVRELAVDNVIAGWEEVG